MIQKHEYGVYHQAVARSTQIERSLKDAEENNKLKKQFMDQRDGCLAKAQTLREYEDKLDLFIKGSMLKVEQYRDECIRNLEDRIENILEILMPEEQFKVQITFKLFRGKYYSDILIGKESNGQIQWGPPRTQNGDFLKQLISCSAVWALNLLLGSSYILMDEPFSSADPVNVSKLQPIFDMMLESGMQIIVIEHKVELYEGVRHNEINLLKHRHPTDDYMGFVEVLGCEIEEGSNGATSDSVGELSPETEQLSGT